ncbi:hypothetical protein ACQEU6_06715 [Spirillospora sp. CA-108201]
MSAITFKTFSVGVAATGVLALGADVGAAQQAAAAPATASALRAPTGPTAPVIYAENTVGDPAKVAAKRKTTTVTYRTFIKNSKVSALGCYYSDPTGGTRYWFTGDGRSYSTAKRSYRTMMRVSINWKKKKITVTKDVGTSKVINRKGKVVARKRASMKKMKVINAKVNKNGKSAGFQLDHSATNPFCKKTGGSIRYKLGMSVFKDGKYILVGWRQKAPHHEMFIDHNDTKPKFLFRAKNHGFICLQPGLCKRQYFS